MAVSLETFLSELGAAKDKQEVWRKTQRFFEVMGFDRILYCDLKQDELEILTSFPQYWLDHYIDQEYERIDPFFTHCCANYESVEMGVDYMDRYDYLNAPQRQLIQEAAEAGATAGFSITFKPLDIHGAGGWCIGSSLGKVEVEKIKHEHEETLRIASNFAYEALQNLTSSNTLQAALSAREKECLLWLVKGMRTKEIAFRLGIRPVTVELYISNIKKKLKARTREHAVAKALTLQLINP